MEAYEASEVERLAKEAERQAMDEKFKIEHEEHLRKLREQEDMDEIEDDHTFKEFPENEEEMSE